jgi:hypothetical protein
VAKNKTTVKSRPVVLWSSDSKVDVATGWMARIRRLTTGTRDISLRRGVQTGSGTHPASYPMGTEGPPSQWVLRAFSPLVRRLGREADHSPPSRAEFKNGGAITPLPNTSSVCVVKKKGKDNPVPGHEGP